jgi:hypothetical protein
VKVELPENRDVARQGLRDRLHEKHKNSDATPQSDNLRCNQSYHGSMRWLKECKITVRKL